MKWTRKPTLFGVDRRNFDEPVMTERDKQRIAEMKAKETKPAIPKGALANLRLM